MVNTNHYDLDIDTTLGGNNASDYVIPSQKAIKSYVDNNTGTTVDQTFDGTSTNAQSGVAINGELTSHYQPKLVSGTTIKTINNTSLLGSGNISVLQNNSDVNATGALSILGDYNLYQGAISIGKDAASSGVFSVSLGEDAGAGEYSIAIGLNAVANTYSAIQIGEGTNSNSETLSVGFRGKEGAVNPVNYQLLDGSTGLIPDARISSNIARTSAIPTQASDISAADTTLSNVSSIDSNSAVATALDGKVSKSGDTMTGDLTITKELDGIAYYVCNISDLGQDESVSSNTYQSMLRITDKDNNRMGNIEYYKGPDGSHAIIISDKKDTATATYSTLHVGFDANGNSYSLFSNTKCCDGQYVHAYQSIVTGLNINNSSNTNTGWYSLSLPNDSYSYLVWINCHVTTGNTSGNYGIAKVISDIETVGISGAGARTRTSSSQFSEANVVIPVDSNHRVKFVRNSNWNATADFTMVGYRRIGTNA